MDDATFLNQLECCTLPFELWTHRAHIRAAYLYLDQYPLEQAIARVRATIQAYNAANNIPSGPDMGYHETITQAWMRLIDATRRNHGPREDEHAFFERHSYLQNKMLLLLFYSRDRIMSEDARLRFVEPDLTPLPVYRK